MCRNRIIWLILFISGLVAISFYGGIISYGFLIMVTMVPVVSILYLLYVYAFFHMYQKVESKWLVANQSSPFYFTLVNDYHFLFSGIRVKFYSDFSSISGLSEDTEYEFMPGEGITKETNLLCKFRGEYEVGIKTVVIQDYFRLFTISYKNREPLKVVVRPALIHLNSLKSFEENISIKESLTNRVEPDVLVRNYLPGDDIRQIHWALTAKNQELLVRQKIGMEQEGVAILLLAQRKSPDIKDYIPSESKLLEITLALSLYFVKRNIPVTHIHRQGQLMTRNISGVEQFDEYYDFVSAISFDSKEEDGLLLADISNSQLLFSKKAVFIVAQELSAQIYGLLELLNQNGVGTAIYLVAKENGREKLLCKPEQTSLLLVGPEDKLEEVME